MLLLLLLLFQSLSSSYFQVQVDAFVLWQPAHTGASRSIQAEKPWQRRRQDFFIKNNRTKQVVQSQCRLIVNHDNSNAIIWRRQKNRGKLMMIVASSSSSEEEEEEEEINESSSQVGDNGSGDSKGKKRRNSSKKIFVSKLYSTAGIATITSWIVTSIVALSFHPDPKFKDCTLRHNILTMSQAFTFPLPIAYSSFRALYLCAKHDALDSAVARRLNLGVFVFSAWLMAASSPSFSKNFAFGYDLYSTKLKIIAATIHGITALFALTMSVLWSPSFSSTLSSLPSVISGMVRGVIDSFWKVGPSNNGISSTSYGNSSSLYATGTIGLLWFTILPIVSPYPLATIPTILGKRLSRPASAFTLLGTIIAYCLKEQEDDRQQQHPLNENIANEGDRTAIISQSSRRNSLGSIQETLRMGLLQGSGAHLALVFLKLIGIDGGGWIFPGNGLQEVYPAMISVPFATSVSLATHGILCFAASTTYTPKITTKV